MALESVGDAWIETHNWCNEFNNEKDVIENISLEQLGMEASVFVTSALLSQS